MSIKLLGDSSHTFGKIQTDDVDRITLKSTGHTSISSTAALKVPAGTTAQRPVVPVQGDMRYSTTNTALELYNGTAWKTIGALDGSSSALAAPSAVYLRDVAGIQTNGTYWINVGGTPTQIYCNFTTAGGGWMSFASAPGSGNWFSGNSGFAPWAGLSYSFGTYSAAGSIGNYWRNYSAQGVTEILFITGNGTYWIKYPMSNVTTAYNNNGYYENVSTGYTSSGNFPGNYANANNVMSFLYRSGNPEDPWTNAGSTHANGGTDVATQDFMFWGENAATGHTSFKNANGGIIGFVR